MMRARAAAISIVAALAASNTSAAAPTKPAAAPAPALPAPAVALTVTPGTGGGPWKLTIQNNGEVPVRLAADPRLLTLELTRAGGEKTAKKAKGEPATLTCVLPQDARPSSDEGSELVVPAKRSYSRAFDPLFYCFGARERAALVSGTTVKPRFGWSLPARAKTAKAAAPSPPFAVAPVGAAVGQIAAMKELEGAPFTLGEAVVVTPAPAPSADGSASSPSDATLSEGDIDLTLPEATDAARGIDIGTTVTLTNRGSRSLTLLFRPQTLLFSVNGPGGAVACGTPPVIEGPIRELYSTVGAKAKAQQTLLLTAVCPPGTFDEPGIYRVLPRIDTSTASARKLGLPTWDGKASGKVPMLLRVRSPRRPTTLPKPALD